MRILEYYLGNWWGICAVKKLNRNLFKHVKLSKYAIKCFTKKEVIKAKLFALFNKDIKIEIIREDKK